ncbi:N-6 DNA methylase [Candidatus Falkowbacteria bacterium]|nr:N-6 DNA methylase [Candidatus Falkowbacteria bacterium]
MAHSKTPKNSEVDAYSYIRNELEKLGWVVKNPARVPEGEVYKQNEGLYNLDIKEMLDRDMPEAIIKLNGCDLWVIESKRDKKEIEKALDEAKNQYAQKINKSKKIKCVIITGLAGNDTDGYTIINQYLHNGKWETILFNGKPKDTLLSKEQALYLLNNKTPNWQEFPDFPEEKYFSSAETINEILHNAGVNKNKRARFIAGLVLSLSLNQDIDLRLENTTTLVKNINNLIEQKLSEVTKENFFEFIKLEVPPSKENHIKYRRAIIDTLKELQTLDIKNAMASGNDVLGKFYEKFLKYGNGAKEIGIVLTPRHITEFASEVLDVKYNDYVFDPTCGTGGFLVSAFDYVKKNSNEKQIDKFKNYNLFGIEQDDEVVALALVNMIFRGDGRNNMSEGNCFQKNILETQKEGIVTGYYEKGFNTIEKKKNKKGEVKEYVKEIKDNPSPIITRVLMNPPFSLKSGDEKERHFIDYALSQMQDGGVLFAIIPISVMVEKPERHWRAELLKKNTLLSVITFPEDLFNPSASVGTIGIFIKKGNPHNFDNQKVFFGRATHDGYKMRKGKRIKNKFVPDKLSELKEELKSFIINQNLKIKDIPEIKKICLLDKEDCMYNENGKLKGNCELVPEAYIDGRVPTLEELDRGVDDLIRETLAFKIRYHYDLNN